MTASSITLSPSIDPEEEAFKALQNTICVICKRHGITSKDDPRLHEIVGKYQNRYPNLTAESIESRISTSNNDATDYRSNNNNSSSSSSSSAHLQEETVANSQSTAPRNNLSREMDILPTISVAKNDDVYANSRSLIFGNSSEMKLDQQVGDTNSINDHDDNPSFTEDAIMSTREKQGCCAAARQKAQKYE